MEVSIPRYQELRALPKMYSSLQVMRAAAALLVVFFHAADVRRLAKYSWQKLQQVADSSLQAGCTRPPVRPVRLSSREVTRFGCSWLAGSYPT